MAQTILNQFFNYKIYVLPNVTQFPLVSLAGPIN